MSSARTELLGERKAHGLTHQKIKVAVIDRDLVPFLSVARNDAEPGAIGAVGLEADVIRPGRPAADPDAATAPDYPVIRRAVRHGEVERGVGENPRCERLGRRDRRRTTSATTATTRSRTTGGVSAPPLKRMASGRAGRSSGVNPSGAIASARCLRRNALKVSRDRRVGHERQAELLKADLCSSSGLLGRGRRLGKKPSITTSATSPRVSSDWRLPPMIREPRPAIVTGQRSGGCSPSSFSLAVRHA